MSEALTIGLGSATLAITAFSTLAALIAVYSQCRHGKPKDRFYEDVDGCATPDSLTKFTNNGVKITIFLYSLCGTSTSIGSLVLSSLHRVEEGLILENSFHTTAWALVLIHAICISVHHDAVKSYSLGLGLLGSACFLTISSVPRLIHLAAHNHQLVGSDALLWTVSAISAVGLGITSSLLQRRPDVFFGGRKVDRQYTVSLLSRHTWTWVQPLLRHASALGDIGVDDVPQAHSRLRSQTLKTVWDALNPCLSVVASLWSSYKGRLVLLWAVTLVRCVVSVLPFWFMFRILNILEDRATRVQHVQLFSLILCMALSNLVDSWMEGWAYWYSLSDLALPIRTQISGLVFDKALRRKIISAASQEDHGSDAEEESSRTSSVPKSHQAIVNLVGIDTERLSYFFQYHFLVINGMVKLVIFSAFLLQLLGWMSFAAGIIAWALTLPANTWFSKKVLVESRSLMKLRDAKLSKINEVLLGMRQIKFSALETQWEKRLIALRETELKTLWKFLLADSGLFACWVISPILLAVASLATYVFIHGSLLPSVAFTSIGIFNSLETTLGSLPELVTLGLDSLVSLGRISAYLKEPERENIVTEGPVISFEKASIAWPVEFDERAPTQSKFAIRDLNLSFPSGALSVISGRTGCGKTLLLSAILGEAELLKGSIHAPKSSQSHISFNKWTNPGSTAYISQTPWLENTSIRNNILFGLPHVKTRYDKVIKACALKEDLAALTDADDTELGANGVNLSGGQKWRITLARAVYSQAQILIMEDIFSAVDSHVGAWIFEHCLTGDICEGRTRILVTHHLSLVLPAASFVVELDGGRVAYAGAPKDQVGHEHSNKVSLGEHVSGHQTVDTPVSEPTDARDFPASEQSLAVPRRFMQEEIRRKGTVEGNVCLTYLKSSGGLHLWAACIGVYVAYQTGIFGRAWWLRVWTGQTSANASIGNFHQYSFYSMPFVTSQLPFRSSIQVESLESNVFFYLQVYVAISMGTAVVGILRYISSYFLAVRASKNLFRKMLFTIMHVSMRWLDTVPTGRILNRFTADFNIIDERLSMTWSLFFSNLLRLTGICIASCFASVYLIPPAFVLVGFGVIVGGRYLATSRPLKRLESNAKSPIFELFNTTLTGISTIRAFQRSHTYLAQMHRDLDVWTMTTFYIALANRWMSLRMAFIATLFSIVVGVVIIVNPIDAALAGLALSFILDFSESLRWTIRCYGDMELEMNSMERVVEYMTLETEPLTGEKPVASWPATGSIELTDLEVSYAPYLPPVLKGLSLRIEGNERIGVVGRTGAGKSSITLALFRFLEARSGSIAIDGIDISKVALSELRARLSVIPQNPVLFSGTIRSNLDPFGHHTDDELYQSLERVHLMSSPKHHDIDQSSPVSTTSDSNIFSDLSSLVSESGGNLSQGQQQLLCIARSLLANSKIVVLDEATSAIDVATDTLIQHGMREWFTDKTVIVIAHRLSTIADFDTILVLDHGRMIEFGTPLELWENKGTFRKMCDDTGVAERESLRKRIAGQLRA
ncbi:hypothetical protein FZEAL_3942 [Fusarium zealandicum]|uniref:ATP-dependent bile acid permease n=1 Tax=Fusarium zealandicum TaxID=1053134 RepID=A0A8H4UNH6_9HYPO|nr:hypothetical protein FZEAL_3942 [Fusarium zealandicum]